MKKQKLNLWLLAALLGGMSMSVASCKDNDNDPSAEEQEKQALEMVEQVNSAYDVIDQLADTDDAGDDFLTRTFEPAVGEKGDDDGTRIIDANTMEAAAERFAALAGAAVDETTQSYTWSNPLVGTMTYQKSQDGKSWATVDVDIRQVPHLHKIIYRSPEQAGDNTKGKFEGCAYYRFGDVVSREVDGLDGKVTEYWVCVRPSFSLEGKGDSHWVCLNVLPKKNIATYSYTYSDGEKQTWYLPTKLGKNELHSQNLAELIYALLKPEEWEANVMNTKEMPKLKMFNDFSRDKVKYHNQYFWKNVSDAWSVKKFPNPHPDLDDDEMVSLWSLVFNSNRDKMAQTMEEEDGGLRLLTKGYSWVWTSPDFLGGWNCTLWETIYTYGTGNQSNMHSVSSVNHKKRMEHVKFDCRKMPNPSSNYHEYFDKDLTWRWCIRHATGQDLAKNGQYNVYSKIDGVEDVYRYYRDVYKVDAGDLANTAPEETKLEEVKSRYNEYGAICPGTILEDEKGNKWLCYSGWSDVPGVSTTSDHKARFISLSNIHNKEEDILNSDNTGSFVHDDALLPESEAPVCALFLTELTATNGDGSKAPYTTMRTAMKTAFNIDLEKWETRRDSTLTVGNVESKGWIYSLNVAYLPKGGRTEGTQPFLRCVIDKSGLGDNKDRLPNELAYPRLRFFKKYNDGSGRTLDLTHSFIASEFLGKEDSIKADEFSRCWRDDDKSRDESFKQANQNYDDCIMLLYNQKPSYIWTPYFEKALVVRYMEFDDPSGDIQETYNNMKFTVIYQPTKAAQEIIRKSLCAQSLRSGTNPGAFNWCTMDGEKYELGYHSSNSAWPKANDGRELVK